MQNLIHAQNKNDKTILENVLCKVMCKYENKLYNHIIANCMNSYFPKEFDLVRDLNREEGLNIPHVRLSENDDYLNVKFDSYAYPSSGYIRYLQSEMLLELSNYIFDNDIPLYIVRLTSNSEWPKANCVHYRENYDIGEMLDNYQPAKIIFCPYMHYELLFGQATIGIYLLNEKNHFISKMVIRFFDDKTAPKGCVKLRIPKTVSEFKASI